MLEQRLSGQRLYQQNGHKQTIHDRNSDHLLGTFGHKITKQRKQLKSMHPEKMSDTQIAVVRAPVRYGQTRPTIGRTNRMAEPGCHHKSLESKHDKKEYAESNSPPIRSRNRCGPVLEKQITNVPSPHGKNRYGNSHHSKQLNIQRRTGIEVRQPAQRSLARNDDQFDAHHHNNYPAIDDHATLPG